MHVIDSTIGIVGKMLKDSVWYDAHNSHQVSRSDTLVQRSEIRELRSIRVEP